MSPLLRQALEKLSAFEALAPGRARPPRIERDEWEALALGPGAVEDAVLVGLADASAPRSIPTGS
jgi:hypothetical protein